MKNLNYILKYIGGSRFYGLDTPESDTDWRGVYCNSEPSKILRFQLDPEDIVIDECGEGGDDVVYYELFRFFELLRKTNSQSLEGLWVPKEEQVIGSETYDLIQENRDKLVDTDKLTKSTYGYVINEYRLAMGERTGQLGGKRKAALEKYGFSPKNVAQLIRITTSQEFFQEHGVYPIKLKEFVPEVFEMIYDIKCNPEKYTKDAMEKLCSDYVEVASKTTDRLKLQFDNKVAGDIMHQAYRRFF